MSDPGCKSREIPDWKIYEACFVGFFGTEIDMKETGVGMSTLQRGNTPFFGFCFVCIVFGLSLEKMKIQMVQLTFGTQQLRLW